MAAATSHSAHALGRPIHYLCRKDCKKSRAISSPSFGKSFFPPSHSHAAAGSLLLNRTCSSAAHCLTTGETQIASNFLFLNFFRSSLFSSSGKLGLAESVGSSSGKFGLTKSLAQRRTCVGKVFSQHPQGLGSSIGFEGRKKVGVSSRRVESRSLYGYSGGGLWSNGDGYRGSIVARAAAAAAPAPSGGPWDWLARFWSTFPVFNERLATALQRIGIGWLNVLTVLRVVVVTFCAFGVFVASRRAWVAVRSYASGKSGESGGEGGGDGSPMQMLARGLTTVQKNVGPWSLSDMALGLSAMAKVAEKEPPTMPGKEVEDLSQDSGFLLQAQHWRQLSEAAYAKDSASFSLFSSLPESSIVAAAWEAEATDKAVKPAYAVFVDAPRGAVVLAVRGTSHVIDMLVNSGTAPESFMDRGFAHGGFLLATEKLYEEVVPHIEKAFKEHGRLQKDLKLVIVGHSMGAAVGSMMGLKLQEKFPDLQCWCYCPPACLSLDLAKECSSFTTSFVSAHDLVPRFSIHAVEKLRNKIQEYDWNEVERVAKDDEDFQNVKKALDTLRGFQQSQEEMKGKLKESGIDASEVEGKMSEMSDNLTKSGMTDKLQSLGKQANALIDGTEVEDVEQEEQEEQNLDEMPSLHPPGRLLLLGSNPPGCGKFPESRSDVASERNYGAYPSFDEARKVTWQMLEAQQEDIDEIVVSPWCISDHMLGNMCEGIGYFQSKCPPPVPTTK